jgi:1,4-dihydroxy-2-naphthoate octaprenyltransferase
MAAHAPTRPGSVPAHPPSSADLERLAGYSHLVVSWVADDGYPISVATGFETDIAAGTVSLSAPAISIPTDREIGLLGSHIHPIPGGYDERRYLQVWGRAGAARDGRIDFAPDRVWGWDESVTPFFEYAERSVPQSRRYLAQLSQEKGRTIRPRLSPFWLALRTTRLPFLSATAVPVLLGIAVAASHGAFTWWTALLTLIGGSFAHLAINVTNDIFDTLSGADDANTTPTQFSGGSRVAVYDLVSIRGLAWLAMALFGAATAVGLVLVAVTGHVALVWIGVAGILVGVAYTAPPLKLVYRGLGEIAVAIGFGPIMLLGAYVVQTGRLAWEPLVLSLVPGILIALILFVNEIPDRGSDAETGKRTLPVRFTPDVVRTGYLVFAFAAFAVIVAGVIGGVLPWPTLIALAAVPIVLRVHRGLAAHYDSPYALMAVMGANVNLNLAVGGLLLVAYVVTIVAMQLA